MQWSSDLPAGRTRASAGQIEEGAPSPPLKKLSAYAGVIAGVALLAPLPKDLYGNAASVDAGALHSALTMVALGVSLTIIVTGWISMGKRTRPDTKVLFRSFTGIGILSATYLVFTSLSRSGTGADMVFSGVLHQGMGLTIAAGMLAASYAPHASAAPSGNPRWIAALPGFAAAAILALSFGAAIVPAPPLALIAGAIAAIALLLYGGAGLRLYQRWLRERENDLVYLLASIVTGMLAESLLSLTDGSPEPRHLLGDIYRIAGFILAYVALFHQVARDTAGKPPRMAGIVEDITDRAAVGNALRKSEAQVRSMNLDLENRVSQRTRQLAAANRELEAFSYSVSHDLQAPLRRIERYAEMLAENNGARMDDTGRDMLGRIQEASSHTKRLVADILKLSQVTRSQIDLVTVDVSAMAQRVMGQIERAANPTRQVEVSIEPGITIEGDPAMVQILLDNLLGNAWKFTAKTERPSIRISTIEPTQGKGFYVKDNGAGFDQRYADKLFGAFQRLHSQGDFKGTGIGLAIVQRIANVHGWQIHASGEVGHGATFTIEV